MHIHEGVAGKSPTGKTIIDIDKYQPISRLGGNFYGRIKEIIELPRPTDEECARRAKEFKEQVSTKTLLPEKQIAISTCHAVLHLVANCLHVFAAAIHKH